MSTDFANDTSTSTDVPTATSAAGAGARPDRAAHLSGLAAATRGLLTVPGDPGWDDARAPWQRAVDQHPLAVLEVADASDVAAAVRWAGDHGVAVTAQPVGHGATSALQDVLVLRTRALRQIHVDAPARVARVGAGVKSGELLAALQGSGLTFLAGSSPDPTVVGLALAGGMSWFGRAWGLTANDVLALEVVDPCGRTQRVTRADDPDLFWALRGGGGDFAIVTEVEIALHPAQALYGGRLLWPVEQLEPVLRAFRAVTERAPAELTVWAHVYQFPPFPEVPEPLRGNAFVSVAVAYLGVAEEAERLLAPLRAVGAPVMDLLGNLPMCRLGDIADEPLDPMPTMEHSMLLHDLDDAAVSALVRVAGAASGSPLAVLQVRHLGGAFATPPAGAGAAGHVEEPYLLFALGIPAGPDLAAALDNTFARLDSELASHTSGATVPNFLGVHGDPSRARSAQTLDRLRELKRLRDPQGTIRSNRPVVG